MAAVLAKTMQRRIRAKMRRSGHPSAATTIDPSANGKAKTVCENRMKVRKREREANEVNVELTNSGNRQPVKFPRRYP
jgi:hypothetical protein